MKKYLIVASNERSYLDLKNVVLELKKRNLPYFFLYSNSSERLFPNVNLNQFNYLDILKLNLFHVVKKI